MYRNFFLLDKYKFKDNNYIYIGIKNRNNIIWKQQLKRKLLTKLNKPSNTYYVIISFHKC